MRTFVRRVAVIELAVVAASAVVFVVGMRRKNRTVLGAVRRTNRRVFNPMQMKTAGEPGAYASVIQHVGRTTGHEYRTPVVAVPAGDGFVIALPYGTEADWVKNVLASGSATIGHDGEFRRVDDVAVIPISEADDSFSERDRRAHRWFGVDRALRLR